MIAAASPTAFENLLRNMISSIGFRSGAPTGVMMPEIRPPVGTIRIISSTLFESQLAYSKSISVIYECQRNGQLSDNFSLSEYVCRSTFARRKTEVCRTKFVGLVCRAKSAELAHGQAGAE